RQTDAIFNEVEQVVRAIPATQRPRVYLARRANGLETGNRGSINTEIIERAGGVNVVDVGREGGGLVNVSLEQVLQWNPDTIITTDRNFIDQAKASAWANVAAVQRGRIFLSPSLPYGWIDGPPSLNRILGLQWLAQLFFPNRVRGNIPLQTSNFYRLFYQVDLRDAQLHPLLHGAARHCNSYAGFPSLLNPEKGARNEAQRAQSAQGNDCRGEERTDTRARSNRHRRNRRHRLNHQRGGRRPEAPEGPARLRGHQGLRCHDRN